MKTAIILSGNLRTFLMPIRGRSIRICDLFMQHIVLKNNADVFAFTDTSDFFYDKSIYHTTDPYEVKPLEERSGAEQLRFVDNDVARNIITREIKIIGDNLKYFHVEDPFDITTDPKFDLINTAALTMGGCFPKQMIHQFRKVKHAYHAMKEYETLHNIKYDILVKWRFDNLAKGDLDLQSYDFINTDVYVPGMYAPLVYDWHSFGPPKGMDYCLSLYDILGKFIPEGIAYQCRQCQSYGNTPSCCPVHGSYSSDITLAPEYHLFRTLKDNNIRVNSANSTHHGCPHRYDA